MVNLAYVGAGVHTCPAQRSCAWPACKPSCVTPFYRAVSLGWDSELRSGGQTRAGVPAPHKLGCPGLRFERHLGVAPGIESALERPGILITVLAKLLRQTGAGSFVGSSAVSHDRLIFWNFREMLLKLLKRDSNRSGNFRVRFRPGLGIA